MSSNFTPVTRTHVPTAPELLPEPFPGRPEAPVILLNLNPGFNVEDIEVHQNRAFAEAARRTMLHDIQPYPVYLLDPRFRDASGARWWRTYLAQLLELYGGHRIANTVACVVYFPYHSEQFNFPTLLPSQRYSIELVRVAMTRAAVIAVLRAWSWWRDVLPELATYPHAFRLRNSQRVWVTEGNCRTVSMQSGKPSKTSRLRMQQGSGQPLQQPCLTPGSIG